MLLKSVCNLLCCQVHANLWAFDHYNVRWLGVGEFPSPENINQLKEIENTSSSKGKTHIIRQVILCLWINNISDVNMKLKGKVAQLCPTLCNPMDFFRPEYWSE